MKPKAKTKLEQLGFLDEQLSTPKHDEIMLWLDGNIESIVAGLFPTEWANDDVQKQVRKARAVWLDRIKLGSSLSSEQATQVRLLNADIEHWLISHNIENERECRDRLQTYLSSITSGFPDPGPPPMRPPCQVEYRKWEFPVMDRSFIVGFADFCVGVQEPSLHLCGITSVR